MNKRTEASLVDALSYCSLPRLPEKDNGEGYWLKAIAKVVKSNAIPYYVCAERDKNTLEVKISKDFGDCLAIMRIEEYYPYDYLKPQFLPVFETRKKDERVNYLASLGTHSREQLEAMTMKELTTAIYAVAIMRQDNFEKGNRNGERITEVEAKRAEDENQDE